MSRLIGTDCPCLVSQEVHMETCSWSNVIIHLISDAFLTDRVGVPVTTLSSYSAADLPAASLSHPLSRPLTATLWLVYRRSPNH